MNLRYFLFMWLGIGRTVLGTDQRQPESLGRGIFTEPDAVRAYRRNLLALSGIVVVAGLGGADPKDLAVFGVKLAEERAAVGLGMAVILTQLYWYFMKRQHRKEDGTMNDGPPMRAGPPQENKIEWNTFDLTRRSADLWANRVTVALTLMSWWVVAAWTFDLSLP